MLSASLALVCGWRARPVSQMALLTISLHSISAHWKRNLERGKGAELEGEVPEQALADFGCSRRDTQRVTVQV